MTFNDLTEGAIFVLKLRCPVLLRLSTGKATSEVEGEAVVRVVSLNSSGAEVALMRLGLFGPGVQETGPLSLGATSGSGFVNGSRMSLAFTARMTYRVLEEKQFKDARDTDHFRPRREVFAGKLQVVIGRHLNASSFSVHLERFTLHLTHSLAGIVERVENSALLSLGELRFLQGGPWLACPQELQTVSRRISVRLVQFDKGGGQLTGSGWSVQRDAATSIWGKCCIQIKEILPSIVIPINDAVKNGYLFDIVWSYPGTPGIIYVFFIPQAFLGGGWTYGDGGASARCVLSDKISGNSNAFAHEMGHVFDGDDAGYGSPSGGYSWVGDPCTVLQANGSLVVPNPSLNSLNNCRDAKNDALSCLDACCMRPDPPTPC